MDTNYVYYEFFKKDLSDANLEQTFFPHDDCFVDYFDKPVSCVIKSECVIDDPNYDPNYVPIYDLTDDFMDVPNNVPIDVPINVPIDVPINVPIDVPNNIPLVLTICA